MGYAVLPLHGVADKDGKLVCTCGDIECGSPGKHPHPRLAPHGLKDATGALSKIKTWPAALNYGVVTDPFLVVDARHAGLETWERLWRQPKRHLPHTWEVLTGGGGKHVIFANPAAVRSGNLAKGLDIKAVGGYVVGVGSTHISGNQYRWAPQCAPNQAKLADPPQWLLDELGKQQPQGERIAPGHWEDLFAGSITNGSRNQSFIQVIGHMLGVGVDPFIAWTAVRCMNLVLSVPPEDEETLSGLFNRVMNLELKKRGL
jgi:Bifunctional DNA primase/polymerase, N-terminal